MMRFNRQASSPNGIRNAESLRRPRNLRRRGAALYVYVLSVTLVVSLLGLTSLTLVRVERRQQESAADMAAARQNALAAIEAAYYQMRNTSNWRTTFTHGVSTAQTPFGQGTLSWVMLDNTDNDLADSIYDPVVLRGVGRVGASVWVQQVTVEPVTHNVSAQLHNQVYSLISANSLLSKDYWHGQYFFPNLPSDAISWRVDRVEVYCRRTNDKNYEAKLYLPASTCLPATLVEAVPIDGKSFATTFDWNSFSFSTNSGLSPTVGLCFCLESSDASDSLEVKVDSVLSNSNRKYLEGNKASGWTTTQDNKSLRYRVWGTYTVVRMEFKDGSWMRTSL